MNTHAIKMKEFLQTTRIGRAGIMTMFDGTTKNYGGIRIQGDDFVHYTGKGLREMWPQNGQTTDEMKRLQALDEHALVRSEHIAFTPIPEIAGVIS